RHAPHRAPGGGAGLYRHGAPRYGGVSDMFRHFDFDIIIRSLAYLFYDGMTFTLTLTALATLGGIVFGTALALMRLSWLAPLSILAAGYVNLMRSVPLVLMIFWFYFLVPYLGQWLTAASQPIRF